jgi:RND family efflux transporter MFP subunit
MKIRINLPILLATWLVSATAADAQTLATVTAQASANASLMSADGVVEAVRQTVLSAQVSGAIVELKVKPGDSVAAGQLLARVDARAADQSAAASRAQVLAVRASHEVAAKDFGRQKQLFERGFISRAAMDQAEAVFKASQAQVTAQVAQAGAANFQSDFYLLRAPYAGVVAEVPIVLGDMAMPGKPLLTLYDPASLRVTATIAQADAAGAGGPNVKVELPGLSSNRVVPTRATLLPTADPNTHTLQLRLDLPPGLKGVTPGMFARAWMPRAANTDDGAAAARVLVPASAVFRRAELTGLYVMDQAGKPALRQVRLGRRLEANIEILSGLSAGERVAADPQAAARVR